MLVKYRLHQSVNFKMIAIKKNTRSHCVQYRLKKCLLLGMDPKLIDDVPDSNTIVNRTKQPEVSVPLNFLQNDHSKMTIDEWTMLSNILHAFDEENPSTRIESSIKELSSLPANLRLKSSDIYHMIGQFFIGIQSLIEHSPDICSLSIDAHRAVTKHNLNSAGAYNGIFLCCELDLYNNPVFFNAASVYYGAEFLMNCFKNSIRCDLNGNLIKIMLFVITFSSNCSIVTFDDKESIRIMSSTVDLIRIQNVFVTMLWKYLMYLYGFKEATLRFTSLLKNILDVTHMLELMPKNETHDLTIETIVIETERILVVQN